MVKLIFFEWLRLFMNGKVGPRENANHWQCDETSNHKRPHRIGELAVSDTYVTSWGDVTCLVDNPESRSIVVNTEPCATCIPAGSKHQFPYGGTEPLSGAPGQAPKWK